LQNLQPGQILQGTAVSENINGRLSLQIGVARLIAQTQLSVRPGQTLTLQVLKNDSLPVLRLLQAPTLESLKAEALKQLLPRQQPLPEVFKALTQVLQAPAQTRIPPAVREQAAALINQLPSTADPGFKNRLQRVLVDSGLLTEPRLLHKLVQSGDLKLQLARLFERIAQLLPENRLAQTNLDLRLLQPQTKGSGEALAENGIKLLIGLLKHLDGAIARIQTHQLASLPQEDPGRQVWQFELPVRNGEALDLFHIRIGREDAAGKPDEATVWSLTLHMDLASLGPMRVQLRLQGEELSTLIWSQRPRTNDLVQQHLQKLRAAYEQQGLSVQRLDAFVGQIGQPDAIPVDGSLLHERV
jgi:hypothetical protein